MTRQIEAEHAEWLIEAMARYRAARRALPAARTAVEQAKAAVTTAQAELDEAQIDLHRRVEDIVLDWKVEGEPPV